MPPSEGSGQSESSPPVKPEHLETMMKRLTLVPKRLAAFLIPRIIHPDSVCYYLNDDVSHYLFLKEKFRGKIEINNLSGLFDRTFQEIKLSILDLISKLNKKYDSIEWWGGQLASRNSASTPLLLNISYLFCAKKILSHSEQEVIFIIESHALYDCISEVARRLGYQVIRSGGRVLTFVNGVKRWQLYVVQILYFIWQCYRSRRAAFKFLKPLPNTKTDHEKRLVIRTWVTKGAFNGSGQFKDRNFGPLPAWLRSRGYEVLTLPMFFNLPGPIHQMYKLMRDQGQRFLIPDHYLKGSDYLKILYNGYRLLKRRIEHAVMEEVDLSPLFNEVLKNQGFLPHLSLLNLCYPMLRRMKEKGYEIDAFYYPFENNAPEKQFILGCRAFFPNSKVIGFQHTAFFRNLLTFQWSPHEIGHHPLPDKIVCSGRIYLKLYQQAGFPPKVLKAGPNLRYDSVYKNPSGHRCLSPGEQKIILLPLTFSHDLAFDLMVKVRDALRETQGYKVYIRSHPLLSIRVLLKFLKDIGMDHFGFADEGTIQDWFYKSHVVISSGASITIVESVTSGTPVIRVIPDNTFYYDPFTWPNYPLEPIHSPSEIKRQLERIDEIQRTNQETFQNIAKEVMGEYFTKPDEENMRVFL